MRLSPAIRGLVVFPAATLVLPGIHFALQYRTRIADL
jgi:hypothetical protein